MLAESLSLVELMRGWSVPQYALGLAIAAAGMSGILVYRGLRACQSPPGAAPWVWGGIAGLLTASLTTAMLGMHLQEVPEVRPSELWWRLRPAFHALLLVLLIAATATDLRTYYILDSVTLSGMAAGVLLATLAGDLQMCHLWVDWNAEVPQLRGPYIPEWLAEHPHWHGFLWSTSGLLMGGGITWAARAIASGLMGQEALGFGDVTLMAMIGAFLGWQPTLLVFLLAPLCAVGGALISRLLSSRSYIPYGPFLSLAAVLVLFLWRPLWMFELRLSDVARAEDRGAQFALRRLFGDWIGLLILAGMLLGGLILLLGGLRLYRTFPVTSSRQPLPGQPGEEPQPEGAKRPGESLP